MSTRRSASFRTTSTRAAWDCVDTDTTTPTRIAAANAAVFTRPPRSRPGLTPGRASVLPVVHRSVQPAVHWQVGTHVRMLRGERLVDIHAQPRCIARMHEPALESVCVRKHAVSLGVVRHVFLDAEVVDAQAEVQGGRHADGTQI